MTRVLFIVSSVATVNKHTSEKWDAQPVYASRSMRRTSKADDLTCRLLLSMRSSNSMPLISTMSKWAIANVTVWSGESRKHFTSTRRSTPWTRQRIGIEPNLVQPLPLTPFVVFRKAITLSLSFLLGTYSFFSSFPSHSPVPWRVSLSSSRFLARFIVTHAHSHPRKNFSLASTPRLTT